MNLNTFPIVIFWIVPLFFFCTILPSVRGQERTSVQFGGSSLVKNVCNELFSGFLFANNEVTLTYDPIGSGSGIAKVAAGEWEASLSESLPSEDAIATSFEDLAVVPFLLSPIVPIINIPGVASGVLILRRDVLARIFLGEIDRWNHPDIAAPNPELNLPSATITRVVRAGKSGTTSVFTEALSAFYTPFSERVGTASLPNWPGSPVTAQRTSGLVGTVKSTPYSIGYAPFEQVRTNGVAYALMETLTGDVATVTASSLEEAATVALSQYSPEGAWNGGRGSSLVVVDFAPESQGWPIIATPALILRKRQASSCVNLAAIVRFTEWVYLNQYAGLTIEGMGFARLPGNGRTQLFSLLKRVICNGAGVSPIVHLFGSGASLPGPLYASWASNFRLVAPSTLVFYSTSNSAAGVADVILGRSHFAGSEVKLTQQDIDNVVGTRAGVQRESGFTAADFAAIPTVGTALVPVVNLPGFARNATIVLTGEVLAMIFLGFVSTWRDSTILQANTDIAPLIPDLPITLVVRSDASGTSAVFSQALTVFDPLAEELNPGFLPNWNIYGQSKSILRGRGSSACLRLVEDTPGAIGYQTIGKASTTTKVGYARLRNIYGEVVTADDIHVQAAIDAFFEQGDPVQLVTDGRSPVNVDHPLAWPVVVFSFTVFRRSLADNCESIAKLQDYLLWTQTRNSAAALRESFGFSTLPESAVNAIVKTVHGVSCSDNLLPLEFGCPIVDDQECAGSFCEVAGDGETLKCRCRDGWEGEACDVKKALPPGLVISVSILGTLLTLFVIVLGGYMGRRRWLYYHPPWLLQKKAVTIDDEIGRGAFGIVYVGKFLGQKVAVKKIALSKRARKEMLQAEDILPASETAVSKATRQQHSIALKKQATRNTMRSHLLDSHGKYLPSVSSNLVPDDARTPALLEQGVLTSGLRKRDSRVGLILSTTTGSSSNETSDTSANSGSTGTTGSRRTTKKKGKTTNKFTLRKKSTLMTMFRSEVGMLASLKSPYTTFMYGAYIDRSFGYIVSEHMMRGSVFDIIHSNGPLGEQRRIRIARDAARGMVHLHNQKVPVIHGDLKSLNILVDENWAAKVADFGLAGTKGHVGRGSLLWLAPELLQGETTCPETDVYAFGVFLHEIMTRRVPYDQFSKEEIIQRIGKGVPPDYPDECHAGVRDLARECCHLNPRRRPGFEEIANRLQDMQLEARNDEETSTNNLHNSVLVRKILGSNSAINTFGESGSLDVEPYDCLTFLFFDVVGFTRMSVALDPSVVSVFVTELFQKFHTLVTKFPQLDCLETIGDCYIVVGGIDRTSDPRETAVAMARLAILMQRAVPTTPIDPNLSPTAPITLHDVENDCDIERVNHALGRIGIHQGPAMPSVMGTGHTAKLTFLGDTVNTAARMESTAEAGRIQCTEEMAEHLKTNSNLELTKRHNVSVKGKGVVDTYWVDGATMSITPSTSSKSLSILGSSNNRRLTPSLSQGRLTTRSSTTRPSSGRSMTSALNALIRSEGFDFEKQDTSTRRERLPSIGSRSSAQHQSSPNDMLKPPRLEFQTSDSSQGTLSAAMKLEPNGSSDPETRGSSTLLMNLPGTSELNTRSFDASSVNSGIWREGSQSTIG